MDYASLGSSLQSLLGLQSYPVSIAFLDTVPDGVNHVKSSAPAGCYYWKLASEGKAFYTMAQDHMNCTIGAYTHGVTLPEEKSAELQSTISHMVSLSYLRSEEVASIPRRTSPFKVAVYAPLTLSKLSPDAVVVRGNPKQMMLLIEAAMAAGMGPQAGIMGRPTCAFIAGVIDSGHAIPSLGCIGNRVYTDLGDDELYFAIPGSKINELVSTLEKITGANQALQGYHKERCCMPS